MCFLTVLLNYQSHSSKSFTVKIVNTSIVQTSRMLVSVNPIMVMALLGIFFGNFPTWHRERNHTILCSLTVSFNYHSHSIKIFTVEIVNISIVWTSRLVVSIHPCMVKALLGIFFRNLSTWDNESNGRFCVSLLCYSTISLIVQKVLQLKSETYP